MMSTIQNSSQSLLELLQISLAERRAGMPVRSLEPSSLATSADWLAEIDKLYEDFSVLPEDVREFLACVADLSPYLRRTMLRPSVPLLALLTRPIKDLFVTLSKRLQALHREKDVNIRRQQLRLAKQQVSVLLALADLGRVSTTNDIMKCLSDFADLTIQIAFNSSIRDMMAQTPELFDETTIAQDAYGIAIIAMGKLGGHELNYSSDIDLIVLFDPIVVPFKRDTQDTATIPSNFDIARFMKRVTQAGVAMLNDQTEDGYVFRTDLRLRPNPGATPAAISLSFAEHYYEVSGQNWERAAYIKARPVAGDMALGERFLKILRPFIWRKYLDYAAIEDIHSIKRQIHAVKGGGHIEFAGHDLKLGRGGIREIEFFAQTQQLILGGKNHAFRSRETLATLSALAAAGHVSEKARLELTESYLFLRDIEHRLQMLNDAQTHRLPDSPSQLNAFAHFCGFANKQTFEEVLVAHLRSVQTRYAGLFEGAEQLSLDAGSLVFTGVENDPETIRTLERLGYQDPESISTSIRLWHASGMRATRSVRGRELLTKLIPPMLESLAATDNPDATFRSFERFLEQMPAGVQVFSMFLNNIGVLERVAAVINLSPRLGKMLAERNYLIEELINDSFLNPSNEAALEDIDSNEVEFEAELNKVRRYATERRFQISAQFLLETLSAAEAGRAFSAVADRCFQRLTLASRKEMEQLTPGPEGGLAILGMGRLGADALTATSDLDVVFIYESPDVVLEQATAEQTSFAPAQGPDAATWYARFVRRLLTALTVQTEEGSLYDIDTQLRPAGRAGPMAVNIRSFESYYEKEAWTWELMALLKGRVIYAESNLGERLNKAIDHILTCKRDAAQIKRDVVDMRRRLLDAKPAKSQWDVKLLRGGLTDIDFICLAYSLIFAGDTRFPRHINDVLKRLKAESRLSDKDTNLLLQGSWLFDVILQFERASVGHVIDPGLLMPKQTDILLSMTGFDTLLDLENHLRSLTTDIADCFDRLIGPVSDGLPT